MDDEDRAVRRVAIACPVRPLAQEVRVDLEVGECPPEVDSHRRGDPDPDFYALTMKTPEDVVPPPVSSWGSRPPFALPPPPGGG